MDLTTAFISIVLAWDAAQLPQLPPPCPVVSYRVYDCAEDLCHPGTCQLVAEVGAGKLTATIQIDDSITHVFFVTAFGACGLESYPSNQVFWDPNPMARLLTPDNFRLDQ